MTEIIITEPSILPVLKYIIIDIGVILLSIALVFFRFIKINFWRSLLKLNDIELSINMKKLILVGVILFVLVFDSSTMKFLFDISFESINLYKIEAKVYNHKDNKYAVYNEQSYFFFEVNDSQKLDMDTYFINKECIIEYYRQSERIKKITLAK